MPPQQSSVSSPPVTFRSDERGSVSIIFALSVLPMLLFAGAAIDYARSYTSKSVLQNATDAALLAAMPQVRAGATMSSVQTSIQAFIYAAAHDSSATVPALPTQSADGSTVCVRTQAVVPTTIMQVAGISTVTVSARSCSKFNQDSFEVALVIDNSGSMGNSALTGQTKMQAAQQAATSLVSILAPSGVTQVHPPAFSVVPFTNAVNVGYNNAVNSFTANDLFVDYYGRSSVEWSNFQLPSSTAATNPTSKFDLYTTMGVTWGGCVEERPSPYTVSDTKATQATPDTLFVPYLYPDESDANSNSLNNYLSDSGGTCVNNDAYARADQANGTGDGQTKVCKYRARPSTGNSKFGSGFPAGPNLLCEAASVVPLTTAASSTGPVQTAINNMSPSGDTNLLSGVMWGWRTLSPNGPFNTSAGIDVVNGQAAKSYTFVNTDGSANHKVMILLTDGENHWGGQAGDSSAYGADNNRSAYSAFGFFGQNRLGTTTSSNVYALMNATTQTACTNAKAAGVIIYTVGFTASDGISAAGQTLLQNCATDSAHSFIAADGGQLIAVFQQIANQLSALRLTM